MKKNKKITINRRTGIPVQVPETATEHLSFRVTPSMKESFRSKANRRDMSMTKYMFNLIHNHDDQYALNQFHFDKKESKPRKDHCVEGKSKSDGSCWDGMQKVFDFFKGV